MHETDNPDVTVGPQHEADWPDPSDDSIELPPWPDGEPEVLPLALRGKWVAWSSDGLRIVASAETSEEAVSLAIEAGEPEPILQRA